jgi:bifunctional non-homologous end joining protein LigD
LGHALRLPEPRFALDGELVVLDKEGRSDFDGLASRRHDKRTQLYAFDMLAGDGEDRPWPPRLWKGVLAGLLSGPVDDIFLAEYEQGEICDVLFRVGCSMGIEGIVSKHLDRAYGAGRCKHWVKVKNPAHPAYSRVRDQLDLRQSRRSA